MAANFESTFKLATLPGQTEDPVAQTHSGRLPRRNGYIEVPTGLFIEKVDVGMPSLPPVAFYEFSPEAPSSAPPQLIRKAEEGFSPLALSLRDSVWINESDFPAVRDYAEDLLVHPRATAHLKPERRMEALRRSAMIVVEDIFENPNEENLKRGIKVVSSFVHALMKDPQSYLFLSRLSSHDPYTLQHSVGTASNCIVLAKKMGVDSEEGLVDAGFAGLLHDIGKVKVRTEVINKPGPLDDEEWVEMKKHSEEGYQLIAEQKFISERVKRAILEHHEDKTGKGYPRGLSENEVDLYSKIVALCDTFNALTTTRSYSHARSPFDAFKIIREKLMHKTDERLFHELVQIYGGKL